MFDIGWTEITIILIVAIIVIGPKDLPRVLRTVGQWVGKAKAMTREFRGHVDDMIRETELDEVKKNIESAATFDPNSAIENAIDGGGEIKHAFDFSDEVEKPGDQAMLDPYDDPNDPDDPDGTSVYSNSPVDTSTADVKPKAKRKAASKAKTVKKPRKKKAVAKKIKPARKPDEGDSA